MTFSLTISADTFDAFKAKIIALEEMFAPADPVMPEIKDVVAAAPKSEKDKAAKKVEPKAEEPAKVEPQPEPEAVQEETKADTADVPDKETDPAGFNTFTNDHIIPRVTRVVAKHGKPFMQELLTRFGVAKATQVPADKLPTLLKLMDEALEG